MNTVQKICPNFVTHYIRLAIIYISKKFGKKKKSYDGLHEFEQQQFSIHAFPKENQNLDQTRPTSSVKSNEFLAENLQPQLMSQETSSSEYHDILLELDKLPVKLNLQPYDRYYLLLEEKIKNVNDLFSHGSQTKIHLEQFQNSKSLFKISQIPVSTGFKFIISACLPCSYAYYNEIISQTKKSLPFTKHVKNYIRHESVYPNLSVMGLQFKKIIGLGLQPRSFTFVKYQNSPENGYNFELCVSILNEYDNDQDDENSRKSLKEADVYSITKIKEQNETIYMKTYLQIDLKSIIKAHKIVRKGIKEIGQYYERLYEYIADHYQKETA